MKQYAGYVGAAVNAVRKAVAEHGAPNSFTPGELWNCYGGPEPMHFGREHRGIVRALQTEGFGTCVVYDKAARGEPARIRVQREPVPVVEPTLPPVGRALAARLCPNCHGSSYERDGVTDCAECGGMGTVAE